MSHESRDYPAIIRSHGYRVTPQRLIVLDAVCELAGHATLADIQAKVIDLDPTIDLSTIYRALDVLCAVNLVVESEIGDSGKVYKISGDSDHHHLVCQICGVVVTVPGKALAAMVDEIQAQYGFMVSVDHLTLKGKCANCQANTGSSPG
ncbi:MAG: Fur family transcriptional regulator [Chloroflexota bacterium]